MQVMLAVSAQITVYTIINNNSQFVDRILWEGRNPDLKATFEPGHRRPEHTDHPWGAHTPRMVRMALEIFHIFRSPDSACRVRFPEDAIG